MPWINLTLRRGALTKAVQHAVMAKLTDALMFWEKVTVHVVRAGTGAEKVEQSDDDGSVRPQ